MEAWAHFESLYCTSRQPKVAECWHDRVMEFYRFTEQRNHQCRFASCRFEPWQRLREPAHVIIDNGRDFDAWTFHAQTKAQRKVRVLDKGYVEEVSFGGIYR